MLSVVINMTPATDGTSMDTCRCTALWDVMAGRQPQEVALSFFPAMRTVFGIGCALSQLLNLDHTLASYYSNGHNRYLRLESSTLDKMTHNYRLCLYDSITPTKRNVYLADYM